MKTIIKKTEPSEETELILASHSPRRKQLLEESGYSFHVITPDDDIEDNIQYQETPWDYVQRLAEQKAENVVNHLRLKEKTSFPKTVIVLACDSLAVCHHEILGKPKDRTDARRMLELLNESVHYVYTGICLYRLPNEIWISGVETTQLKMDRLTPQMIEDYLDSGLWQGKAGAFGYQDGNDWLHILQGSSSNVVGLPMERFEKMYQALKTDLKEVNKLGK